MKAKSHIPHGETSAWIAANLYLAFTHLRHGEAERYPEVLLDPAVAGGDAWRPGQRWLHSSYNLCDGDGEFNVYRRGDRFLCAKSKPGWEANHAPLIGDGVMEIRIALSTLSPPPSPGKVFGLALDVTDTKELVLLARRRRARVSRLVGQGHARRRPRAELGEQLDPLDKLFRTSARGFSSPRWKGIDWPVEGAHRPVLAVGLLDPFNDRRSGLPWPPMT